jgi:hypothetical protein
MIEKLNITDLSKLKITTVKGWVVNFTYDNEQYFLHDDSYEDRCIGLYHKLNGRKSEWINGQISLTRPIEYIRLNKGDKYKYSKDGKWNITYSHIDKDFFVKKLTYDGLIDSLFQEECERLKDVVKIKRQRIRELEEEIYVIRKQINELDLV